MTIPLVDLRAQYLGVKGEIDAAMARVLARASFVHAEEVALLERDLAKYCKVKEAVGVSSGSEALRLAMLACGVGPGDEVITSPMTFVATVEAIVHVGATPVFADIEQHTYNLDPSRIEDVVTERTKAIVPVHLYGYPADMRAITQIADARGLIVIEDAAQAQGAKYHGRQAGTIGKVGCFSFYPTYNLGAFGDAGAIVTNDTGIAEQVRLLRDHGRVDKYEHLRPGFNSRMDALQAAVLQVKLTKLDGWNARRRAIASFYRRLIGGDTVVLPAEQPSVEPVYHRFVVRTSRRGHVRRVMTSAGIETGMHFPIPVHLQPGYRSLGYRVGDFPVSERASQEVLSLPMYPELEDDDVAEVVRCFQLAEPAMSMTSLGVAGSLAPGD